MHDDPGMFKGWDALVMWVGLLIPVSLTLWAIVILVISKLLGYQ